MARFKLDMPANYPVPKRGDLVYTNYKRPPEGWTPDMGIPWMAGKMTRLWIVIGVRMMRPKSTPSRCCVWMVRWWELEADTRWRLFENAMRHGGQHWHRFERYQAKKKPTFEQHMRRNDGHQRDY
jgi:hypothetical protein